VCLALATLVKQSGIFLLAGAVVCLAVTGAPGVRSRGQAMASLVAGYAAVIAVFLLWAATHGVLQASQDIIFYKLLVYTSNLRLDQFRDSMMGILREQTLLWCALAPGFRLLYRDHRQQFWTTLVWFLCYLFSACGAGYFYPHHFLLMLPVLCLNAGLVIDALARAAGTRRAVLGALVLLLLARDMVSLLRPLTEDPLTMLRHNWSGYGEVFYEGYVVGDYVKAHTTDADTVYNWGVEWEVYFTSGRAAPTPYLDMEPLLFWAAGWRPERVALNQYFVHMQEQIMADLQTHRPKYFVVTAPFQRLGCPQYFLPDALTRFTQENYKPEATLGGFVVLRRKD
jgi:hypothetical protein